MRDFSLGLNWHLSQTQRFSINYIHSNLIDVGRGNLLLVRYHVNH